MSRSRSLWNVWMVVMVAVLMVAPAAMAETWNGDDADDDLWSSGDNWVGDAAPSSGNTTSIVFDGALRLTPNQDIASPFDLNLLTFAATASSFDVQGSTLRFDGVTPTITQSSGNAQTVTAPVRENGVPLAINVNGAGQLTLSDFRGVNGVTVDGGGTVSMNSADRQYVEDLTIKEGTVIALTYRQVDGTLAIGDGIGAAESAVFQYGAATVLNNTAGPIKVLGDGLYDLAGFGDGPYVYPFELHTGAVISGNRAGGGGDIRVASCTTPATNTAKVVVGAGETLRVENSTWTIHRGGDPSGIDMEILGAVKRNGSARGQTFLKNGNGTLRLANGITDYRGRVQIDDGTLILNGTFSTIDNVNTDIIVVSAGGTLAGNVTFKPSDAGAGPQEIRINASGTLAPGESIGVMTMDTANGTEQMIFDGTAPDPSVLAVELAGAASYDQLVVVDGILRLNGPAGAGHALLDVGLLGGYTPGAGDLFTIINNTGGTIVGTFANDAGGHLVTDAGTFDITYTGGDGNDVVLSNFSGGTIPEPAGLSLLGLVLVGLRRRRH